MINAEKFKEIFGCYATEIWSMPENEFLDWLNSEYQYLAEPKKMSDLISKMKQIVDIIENLPSAQTEPEHTMEEFMYDQDLGNPEDGSL